MVINCMKIEAEIYGMIPNARMDACEKAPPANASSNPNMPLLADWLNSSSLFGSIPGNTMCAPRRYTNTKVMVTMILPLSSSMLQIFLSVCMNFFTDFSDLEQKKTQFECVGANY